MKTEPFYGIEKIQDPEETLVAAAKQWLKDKVSENTNYYNFRIINLTMRVPTLIGDKIRGESFFFLCEYNWKLNAWEKYVAKEIVVVYNKDLRQFVCTSDPVIND